MKSLKDSLIQASGVTSISVREKESERQNKRQGET